MNEYINYVRRTYEYYLLILVPTTYMYSVGASTHIHGEEKRGSDQKDPKMVQIES